MTGWIILAIWFLGLAACGLLAWLDVKRNTPQRWIQIGESRVGVSLRGGTSIEHLERILDRANAIGLAAGAPELWLDDLHILIYREHTKLPSRRRSSAKAAGLYEPVPKIAMVTKRRGIKIWDGYLGRNALIHELMVHHLPFSLGLGENDEESSGFDKSFINLETTLGRIISIYDGFNGGSQK